MLCIFQEQVNTKLKQVRLCGKALKDEYKKKKEYAQRHQRENEEKNVMINMNIYLNIVEG